MCKKLLIMIKATIKVKIEIFNKENEIIKEYDL